MCEQEVMTGFSKKSLQTWQRNDDSRGAKRDNGVSSQSVESGTSNDCMLAISKSGCRTVVSNRPSLCSRERRSNVIVKGGERAKTAD